MPPKNPKSKSIYKTTPVSYMMNFARHHPAEAKRFMELRERKKVNLREDDNIRKAWIAFALRTPAVSAPCSPPVEVVDDEQNI